MPKKSKEDKKERGRPSKYDSSFIDEVQKYLDEAQDRTDKEVESENEMTGRTRYQRVWTVNLPTVEGFARRIGVNKTTLYEWAQVDEDFSNALGLILTEQKTRLINKGLSNDYNPTITKLILSSNHGMSEKSEVELRDKRLIDDLDTHEEN